MPGPPSAPDPDPTVVPSPAPGDDPVRGFILQPTYRIDRGRAVVHLYGRLETGESFLVRDGRSTPYFFTRSDHREDVLEILAAGAPRTSTRPRLPRLVASDRLTLAGEAVDRLELVRPSDAPPLRDRIHRAGFPTYEADVRFAMRYLIDRGIRSSLAIQGTWRAGQGVDRIYDDPEISPADWAPRLSVLSLDIETDPKAERVLSAALFGCGAAEVLMVRPEDDDGAAVAAAGAIAGVALFATEADLLQGLARRVRELDPDVLTGWNVVDFDLRVLVAASERWGGLLELGRGPGTVRLRSGLGGGPGRGPGGRRAAPTASVPGRLVLDGIHLLRAAFVRMDSYGLDAVASEVLGEGKTLAGGDRGEEISRLWREDPEAFAAYNLTDARLVAEILDRLHLIELAVERSRLTGLPPDRMGASIAAFDFLYLTELGRRGWVAPTVGVGDEEIGETAGGHVLEPRAGLYENVAVFDFRSLYPSIIRTFGIDPLGRIDTPDEHYVQPARPPAELEVQPGPERRSPVAGAAGEASGDDEPPIVAPNGVAFGRGGGILPALLDELFPRREAADRAGDQVASHAIKILMNSFYGVLATPACRFYDPRLANAITSFGREVLLWGRDWIEESGSDVLYGDTDSLFVATGAGDLAAAREVAEDLAARVNTALAAWIAERWGVESKLELRFERLYLKILFPLARGGGGAAGAGARKRYAGLVEEGGETKTVFTGMEVVRRDWTDLAHRVQRELYERLFAGDPIERYLRGVLADLRAGELDDLLTYRKGLRKDLADYTSTTPPHVAAARKLPGPPPDVMAYVITVAGPEPAADRRHDFDYEHYVEKQVRPVAEPVLEVVDLDFDAIAGRGSQLKLF